MKSSLVTENGHRTKTNPDHSSKISYSSCKSCLSSERKTQVKATCKVLCEMREDKSSKLAMKFTQLQIVLATQSIIQVISKFKSVKLQTYFWILLKDSSIRKPSLQSHYVQSISLPQDFEDYSQMQIKPQPKFKQRHHIQSPISQILMQVLNKLKQKQERFLIQLINKHTKLCKGTIILFKFIKKYHTQQQCSSFICIMQFNQNNILDYKWKDIEQTQLQQQDNSIQVISIKEQLAIKFASTTILTSLLNEKQRKMNFYFFLNFLRLQNKSKFIKEPNLYQGIEESQPNYDQSSFQENQQIRGASNLHSFLFVKLKNYFQAIKIFHLKNDYQMIDTMNTMIINKNCDLSNSFEDFDTQGILDSNLKTEENVEIGIKQSGELKKILFIQNIVDIEESTQSIILEHQPLQQNMIKKKQKNQHNKIKNAIKSYCNLQLQKRVGQENTIKVESFDMIEMQVMRKQQNHNKLYTPYLLIVVMTILLILFLK